MKTQSTICGELTEAEEAAVSALYKTSETVKRTWGSGVVLSGYAELLKTELGDGGEFTKVMSALSIGKHLILA